MPAAKAPGHDLGADDAERSRGRTARRRRAWWQNWNEAEAAKAPPSAHGSRERSRSPGRSGTAPATRTRSSSPRRADSPHPKAVTFRDPGVEVFLVPSDTNDPAAISSAGETGQQRRENSRRDGILRPPKGKGKNGNKGGRGYPREASPARPSAASEAVQPGGAAGNQPAPGASLKGSSKGDGRRRRAKNGKGKGRAGAPLE